MKLRNKNAIIVILAIVLIAIIPFVLGLPQNVLSGFGVELWVGNIAPNIKLDTARSSALTGIDPVEASSVLVWFVFNVTDDNGEDDINKTSGKLNLTLGSRGFAQFRYNSSCTNVSTVPQDNKVVFNCSIYMQYYDNASSSWVVNLSASDLNSASAINDTHNFIYNTLSAINLPSVLINFTSLTLGDQNQPAGGLKLVLNNTGNDDFTKINITAADLIGVDTPSESIAPSNFVVNYTNSVDGAGIPLTAGAVTIPGRDATSNLTLLHGHTDALTEYNDNVISAYGNQSLYFWIDVPASGISAQKYNNTWNVTVIT